MPDVRMPDGTIIRNVPATATRAQIQDAYERARQAGEVKDKRPTSFGKGAVEGAARPVTNTARMLGNPTGQTGGFSPFGPLLGPLIDAGGQLVQAATDKFSRSGNTRGSTGGRITGEIAATLPLGAMRGGAAVQGAAQGMLTSRNIRDPREVATNVAAGAAFGKLGEQVGKRIVAPVAERIGRTAPARAVANGVSAAASKLTGRNIPRLPNPQRTAADRAVGRMAPQYDTVRQNVTDAADLGLPYSLADADPRLRILAGSVARRSPEARTLAEQTFEPRAMDQGARLIDAVGSLAKPIDPKANSSAIMNAAINKARPYYEEAFKGGSMAPLQTQLEDAYRLSSSAVSSAADDLARARVNATVASAGLHRAGDNVYGNARALPLNREAANALSEAEKAFNLAKARQAASIDALRSAQGDAASNAPGAVWNPRIQQFLDDPIAQAGLSRGMEVQRLEALASGKPFDPTEYALIDGEVAKVPNMRTLDAMKRGLDEIINDYPKDVKGKAVLDQRGRAVDMVRKSLLGELDAVNRDYAAARGVYQKFAQSRDALRKGYDAPAKGVFARDIEAVIGGYSPREAAQFRSGYASRIADDVSNMGDNVNPWKNVYGGNERRAKLSAVFPEGAPRFDRQYQLEGDMSRTATETLGGSPTAARLSADQAFDSGAGQVVSNGLDLATGGKLGLLRRGAQFAGDRIRAGSEARAAQIAPTLYNTDARAVLQYLDDLARKDAEAEVRRRAYAKASGLLGGPAAIGGISLLGQ